MPTTRRRISVLSLLSTPPVLGLAVGLTVGACGNDSGSTATGGTPGCDTDYTRLSNHAEVSLRNDVMPIFGLSCSMSSCHDAGTHKAALVLGPKCTFNNQTKGCDFLPALTDADVTTVRDALVGIKSKTAPAVDLVRAGDPTNSFLVMKTAGVQNDQGLTCIKIGGASDPPCGLAMPWGTDALCVSDAVGATKQETLAAWVLQGAKNN